MSVDGSSSFCEEQKSLQTYGQTQYRFGNYEEALDAFNKALSIGKGDLLGLLDNRAATFCALKDLDSALQDGRRMIKSDKSDPRGYLRTAKVMQLQKKLDGALRLYKYALQALDPNDPGRQQVEWPLAKLQKALDPPTRLDPFAILPLEIVTMILEYMDIRLMMRIIRVSKLWERLGPSARGPWSHLDLSMGRKTVSLRSVQAYLRRALPAVKEVTLARYTPTQILNVTSLLAKCPNLVQFNMMKLDSSAQYDLSALFSLSKLTALNIDHSVIITHGQFCSILRSFPGLEEATLCVRPDPNTPVNLPFAPRLKHLQLISYKYLGHFLYNESISLQMPNLEKIQLFCAINELSRHTTRLDLTDLSRLRKFSIFGLGLKECPMFPSSLEHLTFDAGAFWTVNRTDPPTGFSNLKHLELNHMTGSTSQVLDHLLSAPMSSLGTLHVRDCYSISGRDFIRWMKEGYFRSITVLNVNGTCDVNDSMVDAVVSTMPNLTHLDVSRTAVTGLSVKSLADTDNLKLEKLVVRGLATPIHKDAIEYGRNRGIQIPPPFSSA